MYGKGEEGCTAWKDDLTVQGTSAEHGSLISISTRGLGGAVTSIRERVASA